MLPSWRGRPPARGIGDRRLGDSVRYAVNAAQQLGLVLTPYAWATHIAIGAVIQALVAMTLSLARVSRAWWFGAAVSIGYAWSREKTELEFVLKEAAHGHSVGPYWYRGFVPLEWDWASQVQFYAPAVAVLLIAALVERRPAAKQQKSAPVKSRRAARGR